MSATRITKWTREKGGRRDFVDPTRRSHARSALRLDPVRSSRLLQLAQGGPSKGAPSEGDPGSVVGREKDPEVAQLRRRISQLRAHLSELGINDIPPPVAPPRSSSPASPAPDKPQEPSKESLEALKEAARRRALHLQRVRRNMPRKKEILTPDQRASIIKKEVLQELPKQRATKLEAQKVRQEEEAAWARQIEREQRQYVQDLLREKELVRAKQQRLKKELQALCEEKNQREEKKKEKEKEEKEAKEYKDYLYWKYQEENEAQKAKDKERLRREAEKEIEKAKQWRQEEEARSRMDDERILAYSLAKRAYARQMKHKHMQRIRGHREGRIGRGDIAQNSVAAAEPTKPTVEGTEEG
ncbi:uncharacterized protein LOC143030035 [Oratosquilla oratoria]|uniref:uncharacterized protein LOC143030035 n=1 Tax=Oratosquilla oratoria TaxID=337810 RepID=UPI003F75F70E